jgi:signal transduction histidine kinase
MELQTIFETAGYLLGSILHGALLRLVARRPQRRKGEMLFAALAACLLVWNAANLTRAFGESLVQRRIAWLERGTEIFALPALVLIPSLLLDTLLTLRRREPSRVHVRVLLYLPVVGLAAAFASASPLGPKLLGGWLVGSLAAGAGISLDLARCTARRPQAQPTTANFYQLLAATLLLTAGIAATIVFLVGRGAGGAAFLLEFLVVAASTVPSGILAYGVYRYYAITPLLRRGAVNLGFALIAIAIYLLGISTASHALEQSYGWNRRVIEALGLVALVFAMHPFRHRALESLSWAFDPGGTKKTAILHGLAADLTRPGASQPAELAARVATGVQEALLLERAALAIAPRSGEPVPASPPGWIDYRALLASIAGAPSAMTALDELPDAALAKALTEARVERIRPLRYEGVLVGALVLGRRADSTAIADDELVAVEAIAGPLAAACTSVRLVDEKLALERRLQEEQRLASLGRFSATVAHRVKNPLASIKAIAQTLREDLGPTDPRRQDLSIVVEEVDALTKVVSQLLGFARGAPGGAAGPVEVRAMAEDVLVLMQHQAAAAEVVLALDAAPNLAPALAEPSGLREVLANLVENAIHASPAGGTVRVELRPGHPGELRIRVCDEGVGVAPSVRGRLFEPFFTTRPGGTGLGLVVSRQRAEAWGGRIYLEESPPPGARFVLELPEAAIDQRAEGRGGTQREASNRGQRA